MKYLSLILWVTQFGFSVLFPICFCLMLAYWLMSRYGFGIWIMAVLGVLGFLTSIRTAQRLIRFLLKETERTDQEDEPPTAFHDHA